MPVSTGMIITALGSIIASARAISLSFTHSLCCKVCTSFPSCLSPSTVSVASAHFLYHIYYSIVVSFLSVCIDFKLEFADDIFGAKEEGVVIDGSELTE